MEYRNGLGETGHGLIVSGQEAELHVGSEIANVYGKLTIIYFTTHLSHVLYR